ncbi:uncharacterized protein [Battus philenor]|uniref:uncharacterized protein n=1 Tax=Battus philenor TaxID=42288 RepID=UPI0035D0962B
MVTWHLQFIIVIFILDLLDLGLSYRFRPKRLHSASPKENKLVCPPHRRTSYGVLAGQWSQIQRHKVSVLCFVTYPLPLQHATLLSYLDLFAPSQHKGSRSTSKQWNPLYSSLCSLRCEIGSNIRRSVEELRSTVAQRTVRLDWQWQLRRLGRDDGIYDVPKSIEDLPEAEPILPGHTLIRPSLGMLKSAVSFPQKDVKNFVYGNMGNLGITYGKSNDRILYTGFRKSNKLLNALLEYIDYLNGIETRSRNGETYTIIAVPVSLINQVIKSDKRIEDWNDDKNSAEILTDSTSKEYYTRRKSKNRNGDKKKSKFRDRDSFYKKERQSSTENSSEQSDDYEKNPGNPYTVHKTRYKQNWMWNHVMSGDHMNVNPFAPKFSGFGPSGAALIFGRKWWYFNQDDYKPL